MKEFEKMSNELLLIILVSMMPVLEARVAFILAFMNNIDSYTAFITIFVSSSIPSLILVFGLSDLERKLIKKYKSMERLYSYILSRIRGKTSKVTKFKIVYVGLALFVAVPLPGTGVWTGSMLSYLLGFDKKLSVLSIVVGNLISCLILYITVYLVGSAVIRN